jgi:transcriptional regulator with GAF, ATPase, and Fis domain
MLPPRKTAPWPPEAAAVPDNCANCQALTACEVVLCDPDPVRASRLKTALGQQLHVVYQNKLEALAEYCRTHSPAAVVLPFDDPSALDSSRILEFLKTYGRQTAVVVYADTGRMPIGLYCQPLAAGARQVANTASPRFLPDLAETLGRLVQDCLAHRAEQEGLEGLFAGFGLVARSAAMREVFRRTLKASHFSDLPVILQGETGTGKQRVAEAIHALDPVRKDRPFLTVNCSALSKSLAESELFGHSRGAFSGASGERKGLFRAANGGTLLLDEVAELDPELQPKLLRVLQERRLLPVGEDYEHPIDVRIIAASNRPLAPLVAEGLFREDLYQRLNVFRIEIPPLRQRREDVAVQAAYFLTHYQAGGPARVSGFGPRVLEALQSLSWEGNTRQLENFIREALAHKEGDGDLLRLEDLPRWVFERLAEVPPPPPEDVGSLVEELVDQACGAQLSFADAVEQYERRLLQRVLEQTGGNRTHAAHRLGLTPRTVFAKIKKYQLD